MKNFTARVRATGKRRQLLACASLVLLGGLIYSQQHQILVGIASYLVVNDALDPADLIFLLNGDPNTRPFHAFDLYRHGWAPRILIARAEDSPLVKLGLFPNATDLNTAVLRKLGLPDSQLIECRTPTGVASTYDEAVVLREYIRQKNVHKVIVVTSSLHTRRASWVLRKALRGQPVTLLFSPAHDAKYDETNWWRIEDGWIGVQNEYSKLIFYLIRYGL